MRDHEHRTTRRSDERDDQRAAGRSERNDVLRVQTIPQEVGGVGPDRLDHAGQIVLRNAQPLAEPRDTQLGTTQLPLGQVFTVISNTAASAISGRFQSLADGAIVNANGNNLQASYTGGDGNDLILAVVP